MYESFYAVPDQEDTAAQWAKQEPGLRPQERGRELTR
jgi:hypothetical protein